MQHMHAVHDGDRDKKIKINSQHMYVQNDPTDIRGFKGTFVLVKPTLLHLKKAMSDSQQILFKP